MEFFRDNKFIGAWLIVTLLISLFLGFLLLRSRSAYKTSQAAYAGIKGGPTAKGSVIALQKSSPYPSAENLEAQEAEVHKLREKAESLRMELTAFQRDLLPISPPDLQAKIKTRVAELKDLANTKQVKLTDTFNLDLGQYISQPPKPGICPLLDVQVDSLVWLAKTMMESGVSSIDGIERGRLPVESVGAPKEGEGQAVIERYPSQLTFTGDMASVQSFLNAVSNAGEETDLFHVVRLVRVENTRKQGPERIEQEESPQTVVENDSDDPGIFAPPPLAGFGVGDDGGGEGETDATIILGEEAVQIFAKIELLRFTTEPLAGASPEPAATATPAAAPGA